MKRRVAKRTGSGESLKRPKLVIGKPGSRSRSRSMISRSSKQSGSPKGMRSKESILSGREKEVSREFLQSFVHSIGDPQLRQIVKPCKLKKHQQIQDNSQLRLSLCCHWKHCIHHQKLLKEHLSNFKDNLIPIVQYHGKGCDGKRCRKYRIPAKSQAVTKQKNKQTVNQTTATQKHTLEAQDATQADTSEKTLGIATATKSGEKSPCQQTTVKPHVKRPSQPCALKDHKVPEVDPSKMSTGIATATKSGEKSPCQQKTVKPHRKRPSDLVIIPQVDTSKMHYGTSRASTSYEPPQYLPPLDFGLPPPQTPTRKTLHVVKIDVHHDNTPAKPTKLEKQAPPSPQTQEDFVPAGTSKVSTVRKAGKAGRSFIPVPVKATQVVQIPAPPSSRSGAGDDSSALFFDAYDGPPSTSKVTPALKKKSPSRDVSGLSTEDDESSDSEIEVVTSGPENWMKLYWEWSMEALSNIKSWFKGKKKMTILSEGADSSAPPLKKIRLTQPARKPAPKSNHPMATPIDAVAPEKLSPKKPPSTPVARSPQLQRKSSVPFHKTSEFKFMLELQEKFNLQENRKKELLDSAFLFEQFPEEDVISVMLNGYGGLVDTHKAHSPDDGSPNTEGVSPVATLCNLGNTCFLNSVLYTLRFAPHFLHNLHHLATDLVEFSGRYSHLKTKSSSLGRGIGGGSKTWSNKDLSTMGQGTTQEDKIALATLRLHELYEALHNAELKDRIEPYQPEIFLTALREVNSIFEGNQQHDAHELLVCLLDTIRETCRQLSQLNERQRCIIPQPSPPTCPLPPAKSSFSSNVRKSLKLGKTKSNGVLEKRNTLSATKLGKIIIPCSEIMAPPADLASEPQPCPDSVPTNKPEPGQSHPEPSYLHLSESIQKKIKARESSSKTNVAGETQPSDGPLICDQALGQNEEEGPRVGHNFISEDFEGLMHLYTTCLECEKTNQRPESFIDICIPVTPPTGSCVTAEEMSALYHSAIVTEEYLQDANKYWCEFCGRYNEARRTISFETLPRLLIFQLKRFSSSLGACVQKLNEFMPTPILLSCFCKKCKDLEEHRKPHRGYQLYGIIMHLGSTMASGHYVTYVCGRDTVTDCANCTRDKRKTASLSGGAGKPAANSVVERHGLFRFFKSSKSAYPSALDSRSTYYPPCRSADCCGVKLESNEPVWLECDDDTVRTISRKQLEELLGPKTTKNAALTPYLLFYSRIQ